MPRNTKESSEQAANRFSTTNDKNTLRPKEETIEKAESNHDSLRNSDFLWVAYNLFDSPENSWHFDHKGKEKFGNLSVNYAT